MRKLRTATTIVFLSLILAGMTSCEVTTHTENVRHRGWFHRRDNDHREKRTVLIIGQGNQENREHHDDDNH